MQNIILNNGVEMPMLGFGVFQMTNPDECEQSVLAAIHAGYRLLDTAASYGNEIQVGNAIRNSGIDCKELWAPLIIPFLQKLADIPAHRNIALSLCGYFFQLLYRQLYQLHHHGS